MTPRVYTAKQRAQKRRYYEAVVAEGDCWMCRETPAEKPSIYCADCRRAKAFKKQAAKEVRA